MSILSFQTAGRTFFVILVKALMMPQLAQANIHMPSIPEANIPASSLPEPALFLTEQLTSVDQLSDVKTTDWAFKALQSLVEQYGCIVGFPTEDYQGNRSLTRFEFAAGLNACLNNIEQQLAAAIDPLATQADLAVLQRLQVEFAAELTSLTGQVEALETRLQALDNNFSTTTQLRGDVVFALQDLWGESSGAENNLVFQGRSTLVFDTSFSGEDRLKASIEVGNFERFELPDDSSEGRVAFDTNTDQEFELSDLFYEFPVSDRVNLVAIAQGGNFGSVVESINPLASSGRGALSRFAQRNPILRGAGFDDGAGVGASFDLRDDVLLSLGYISADSSDPEAGKGLFNGGYGIGGQLVITPGDFALSLTYAHSYVSDEGNDTGTGSLLSAVAVEYPNSDNIKPVVINAYGLELNYRIANWIEVGGWAGFSSVRVLGTGDAEVWNYALRLAFPDLGGEGNLGGLVVGMQPRLTGTTAGLGAELGQRQDADVGLHIEGFYRIRLTDNLSLTPGIIWLTAPNHDEQNADIVLGVVRVTFSF